MTAGLVYLRMALYLTILAAVGCVPESTPEREDTEDAVPASSPADSLPPVGARDSLAARLPMLADSVRIEGMWQSERLTLVRSPAGFEPPFSTYLPDGLEVEYGAADTPSVRFVAAFAGQRNPAAYLEVRIQPAGTDETRARSEAEAYLRGGDRRGSEVTPSGGWPWTRAAWDFQYGSGERGMFMGTVGVARHGDRWFQLVAHYPAEYGDGVGPRFHRILREWRWEGDGARLVPD